MVERIRLPKAEQIFDPALVAQLDVEDQLALRWLEGVMDPKGPRRGHDRLAANLLAGADRELRYSDVESGPASVVTRLLGVFPFLHAWAGYPEKADAPLGESPIVGGFGSGLPALLSPAVVAARAYGAALRVAQGSVTSMSNEDALRQGWSEKSKPPVGSLEARFGGSAELGNAVTTCNLLLRRDLTFASWWIRKKLKDLDVRPVWLLQSPSNLLPVPLCTTVPGKLPRFNGLVPEPPIAAAHMRAVREDVPPLMFDVAPKLVNAPGKPKQRRAGYWHKSWSQQESPRGRVRVATANDLDRWLAQRLVLPVDSPQIEFAPRPFPSGVESFGGDQTRYSGFWVVEAKGTFDLQLIDMPGDPSFIEGPGAHIVWSSSGLREQQRVYGNDGTCWSGDPDNGVAPTMYSDSAAWVEIINSIGTDFRKMPELLEGPVAELYRSRSSERRSDWCMDSRWVTMGACGGIGD
jgi:hypothetical protein